MTLQKYSFSELNRDDIFLDQQGSMYRRLSEDVAQLVRLPSGAEPDEDTFKTFPTDEVVELVPKIRSNTRE